MSLFILPTFIGLILYIRFYELYICIIFLFYYSVFNTMSWLVYKLGAYFITD
jgi:hypothetical protein